MKKRIFICSTLIMLAISAGFSTCPTPTGIATTLITGNTAKCSWTWNTGTGVSGWSLRYKKTSSSVWNTLSVATNPQNLTGLTASTNYEYQVKSICATSGTSLYSPSEYFTTLSASNSGCNPPTNMAASPVNQNSVDCAWWAVSGASSYTLRYKKTANSTWNTISISSNITNLSGLSASTNYEYQVKTNCSPSSSSNYSSSTNFTTPPGTTFCNTPNGLVVNSINQTSAICSWTTVSGASSYMLKYKKTSSSTWSNITASSSSKNLTGLSASTNYEYQVKTNCSANNSSSYSSSQNFTTAGSSACTTPTGLAVNFISQTSVTCTWTSVSAASNYTLRYKKIANSTWNTITVSINSKNLTGLSASTNYEYQVKTNCSATSSSGYSSSKTFTTSTQFNSPKEPEDENGNERLLISTDKDVVDFENSLNVFPNPVNTNLTISFNVDNSFLSVQLFNINGQQIFEENLNNFNGLYQQILDLSGNPKGIYFLKIIAGDEAVTKKIILNK